ncbi:hypothetical protein [Brevundimonas sp. R86498]|uniref:hypothetical protein n=1 Tax=Brevundimonas sp. R86498 TaxID=3093845 RepID=UPI0037C4F2BB
MSDWIKAINPTSAITTEAEAERAARASAISIFIGVAVGLVSVAWTLANPGAIAEAAAAASTTQGDTDAAAAGAAVATQAAIWGGAAMVVIQLILGVVQWRSPGKFIAILFMVLIALGLASAAITPLMAGLMPDVPTTPIWQIALSVVILVVQLVLHAAGLRGISRLDRIQMEQAR